MTDAGQANSQMKIKWVNHASFVAEFEDVKLICDPWLEGTAFNDGWALLSPTKFDYQDFKDITHIWFSHEHPDHFAPSVLKRIPAEYRKNITVLYHQTIDKKVIKFCRGLGFKETIEQYPDTYLKLGKNLSVLCEKTRNDADSWLYVQTPDFNILNLNDCYFREEKHPVRIKQKIGDVDLLLCQFSYANWCGNENAIQERKDAAQERIDEMLTQIRIFQPRLVVPFASFVWFCNEDNYFMNDEVNRIGDVYEKLKVISGINPIVMYPGFEWDVGQKYAGSGEAIGLYGKDYDRVTDSPQLLASPSVSLEDLKAAAEDYRERSLARNDVAKIMALPPFSCYLTDLDRSLEFSFKKGLVEADCTPERADVSLSSQALYYCFRFDWGFGTLEVSGRFEKPPKGNYNNVAQYLWVSELMNIGKGVPGRYRRGLTKFKQAIGLA
ncbi:MAG: MBL fold metallo-hydrolase [Blastocatellia bacterium]